MSSASQLPALIGSGAGARAVIAAAAMVSSAAIAAAARAASRGRRRNGATAAGTATMPSKRAAFAHTADAVAASSAQRGRAAP